MEFSPKQEVTTHDYMATQPLSNQRAGVTNSSPPLPTIYLQYLIYFYLYRHQAFTTSFLVTPTATFEEPQPVPSAPHGPWQGTSSFLLAYWRSVYP